MDVLLRWKTDFLVGQRLIERFTKDTARFTDAVEILKTICKDFWTIVFKKQIGNLKTNHQGTVRTSGQQILTT